MAHLSTERMVSVRGPVPDAAERTQGHDEDGNHAINGGDHWVSLVGVVRVVGLEDNVIG